MFPPPRPYLCDSAPLIGIKPARGRITMMPIGTPRVPYRVPGKGTWQWVDLWNTRYHERVIFIGQNIDEEFSNHILATMLYLDTVDNSYINGPGGDLDHCVGYAYNLAGFLLAAGEKGQRFAMPLSRIALESPTRAACGDDIQNEVNELLRIRDYLFKELAQKTDQPVEQV
ncbi:ATP-dependent Clp protease proteolytic subunit-related protein 2, chloroplastic [Tanacetum coccineum]